MVGRYYALSMDTIINLYHTHMLLSVDKNNVNRKCSNVLLKLWKFNLSNVKVKVFFFVPNDCTGGLWTVNFVKILSVNIIMFLFGWLYIYCHLAFLVFLGFFVTSRTANSFNFYIQSYKIISSHKKSKRTSSSGKKAAFWVMNTVKSICLMCIGKFIWLLI